MSTLKIGWSEISITPDKKISLAGQFAERISEYVEKPLTVTALALESGDTQGVIVSCDLGSVAWTLVEDVRARLADNKEGLDPKYVMISAIHTHTGPSYAGQRRSAKYTTQKQTGGIGSLREMLETYMPAGCKYVEKQNISDNPEIMAGRECADFLAERIAKAVLDAWKDRREGSFVNAFGRAAIGQCRRVTYSDDSAQMWGDTNTAVFESVEGGNDNGIELLFVYGAEKELRGIVANIACPAQCVQHRLFVSPDYWGEVKVRLRKYFGEDLFLLPLLSAAGDQCPVDMVRWVAPESDVHDPNIEHPHPLRRKADPSMFDISGMKVAGRRVAQEIIAKVLKPGMTLDEQVEALYNYVFKNVHYVGSSNKKDWRSEAVRGLTTGKGDCFTSYACLRLLLEHTGAELMSVERSGGRTHHYWMLVNLGSGWYHVDACNTGKAKKRCFMWTNAQKNKVSKSFWRFDESLYPPIATEPYKKKGK